MNVLMYRDPITGEMKMLRGARGEKGDSYVLTDADKEEIAGMVHVPEGGSASVFVAEVYKTTFAEVSEAKSQKAVFCFDAEEGQTYPLSSYTGGPICFSVYDPYKKTHDTWKLHDDDSWTWESVPADSEGGTVELDTTLTASGKAADAKAVGDALNGKLDKSGGTLTGNLNLSGSIVIHQNGSAGIRDNTDVPVMRYEKTDGELRFRLGQTGARMTMYSSERPLYNGNEIALKKEIPDSYSKTQIDAMMGSYITDIDNLVGGDS